MFTELEGINSRPEPFQYYTTEELWTDEHTSKQMLEYHLNEFVDASSRNKKFIDRSVKWIISHFGVDNKTKDYTQLVLLNKELRLPELIFQKDLLSMQEKRRAKKI
jgi:hypothetical protein